MNCKLGDRAMLVNQYANGKIFTCVELLYVESRFGLEPTWRIDPPWRGEPSEDFPDGGLQEYLFDRVIRPIRDNKGQDETLTWAPVKAGEVSHNRD